MKTHKKILILAAVAALACAPAYAIFGIGDLVFDPSTFAQTVAIASSQASTLTKMIEEVQTATKIYNNAVQTYNLAFQMSQQLQSKNFTGAFGMAMNNIPMDRMGETASWSAAVNSGVNAVNSWHGSTISLQSNPFLAAGSALSARYASAEISAGAGTGALQTLGNVRVAQQQIQAAAQNCESNAISLLPVNNTAMAQSNNTNGCMSLLLRQSQSQIALDTARLDMQLAQAKIQTDAQVEHLNDINMALQTLSSDSAGEPGGGLAAATTTHVER